MEFWPSSSLVKGCTACSQVPNVAADCRVPDAWPTSVLFWTGFEHLSIASLKTWDTYFQQLMVYFQKVKEVNLRGCPLKR